MKTAIVLILAILAQATGNVFLSKGMKQFSIFDISSGHLLPLFLRVIENPVIWLGTGLLLVFFLLYSAALSWADLSFVLPATSFGYIVNVAFAHYFLHETVSPLRWSGTVLIAVGVVLVSQTRVRTAPPLQKENVS